MLTEKVTFVLGRITPVKYKDFGSNSLPNCGKIVYCAFYLEGSGEPWSWSQQTCRHQTCRPWT